MGALNTGAVALDGGEKDGQSTNAELHGAKSLETMLEQGLLDDMTSVFREVGFLSEQQARCNTLSVSFVSVHSPFELSTASKV